MWAIVYAVCLEGDVEYLFLCFLLGTMPLEMQDFVQLFLKGFAPRNRSFGTAWSILQIRPTIESRYMQIWQDALI